MLKGKKILLTVGSTREYLDPVRYLTNESSGKMGFAIAEELHKENAELIIVSGPVNIQQKNVGEGFGYDTNKVSILINGQNIQDYPLKSKSEVAKDITEKIKYFI